MRPSRFRSALPFGVLVALVAAPLLAGCASTRPDDGALARLRADSTTMRADLEAAYSRLEAAQRERDAARARVAELERALAMTGDNGARGETVAVLPTDIFFESGSAQLSAEGTRRLVEVADRLRSQYPGRTIRVEGYTDSQPIGPNLQRTYPSNWELSAARAAMVARHLQWTHSFDGTRMEVVGLGEYHPLATNATAEGREQNRRVRVAVLD
jgi:chemotaxis protein MotB